MSLTLFGSLLLPILPLFITYYELFERYQVRFAALNAADYGTPQARSRIIYIAARHQSAPSPSTLDPMYASVPVAQYLYRNLPKMPAPTHIRLTNSQRSTKFKVPGTAGFDFPGAPGRRKDGSAAHLPVRVADAILGDLPRFDWCVNRLFELFRPLGSWWWALILTLRFRFSFHSSNP